MLRIIVLGAGAGGGFPQWNCNCANCQRARAGDPLTRPATQSSLAVSGDSGASWYLLNASPPTCGNRSLKHRSYNPGIAVATAPSAGSF
jgi:pyrroloquinoline quinone biosynthesis protein B